MSSESAVMARAEHLAAGFLPYHAPTVCPTCLSRFVYCTSSGRRNHAMQAHMALLRYRCHVFWDTLAAFAMREWTPGARTLIDRRLRENHSLCAACVTKESHWGMCGCDYFLHLLDSCCMALSICLARRSSRREANYSEAFVRWPPGQDSLFPFGTSRAVRALVLATGITRHGHALLAAVLVSARDEVFPILSEGTVRQQLISAILARLDMTVTNLTRGSERCESDPARLGPDDNMCPLLLHLCSDLTSDAISTSLLRNYSLELYNAINKVLVRADGSEGGDAYARNSLTYLACELWGALPASERGERPPFLRRVDSTSVALLKDPYRNLHNNLVRISTRKTCFAPTCNLSASEAQPRVELRKCAKCRLAQYCSRECQKADWSGGAHAHREICDMLQELFVFTALGETGEAFSAACAAHDFPLERVDRLIAWSGGEAQDYARGAPAIASLTPETVAQSDIFQPDYVAFLR